MGVDTVKLRSPEIDEGVAAFLEKQCILRSGVELSTGEVLYEITSGELEGSWDSRISFKINREDFRHIQGRLEKVECKPFITVETSIHKFFHGQNVFGDTSNFQGLCCRFIDFLGEIFADETMIDAGISLLPRGELWSACRIDWAEMFSLSPAAQAEFFRALKNVNFPRRAKKEAKYATAVHFPGAFTTLRIYGKGPEFKEHEPARIRRALVLFQQKNDGGKVADFIRGSDSVVSPKAVASLTRYKWIERKLKALQRLADRRLRAEVQINADKLRHDFKGRLPLVSEIDDKYLLKIYEEQIFKLMKEGRSDMETVRTYDRVQARLNLMYGKRAAKTLIGFWMQLAARGDAVVRPEYSDSQFYANRKKLIDAGISWKSSNVVIVDQETALPSGFSLFPNDPRRVQGKVSVNSVFNFCPVEQAELRKAA